MEDIYFDLLDEKTASLVDEIESHIGAAIRVEVNTSRTNTLACKATKDSATILIPDHDYFPNCSVFHELLHIRRSCVYSISQIAVCDTYLNWTDVLENTLTSLDNDIEHFIIVPEEIENYDERKDYWVTTVVTATNNLRTANMPDEDIDRRALINWTFAKHVLHDSEAETETTLLLQERNLEDRAGSFLNDITAYISEKDKLVKVFFNHLGLSTEIGCLEYIDCIRKISHQQPIPELN